MTQPMLHRLRERHPGCTIDVFAPKWSQAVYRRMPEADGILDNPFGHGALRLRERWRVGRELGKRGYDQVIATAGSLKMGLLAFATGIRRRTGYVGEQRYLLLNDIRRLDKAALPLMVDRYTALACESQADFDGVSSRPAFAISPASVAAALAKHNLNTDKPVIAFCPGAEYGPAKRWPARHFAETARHYLRQNRFGRCDRPARLCRHGLLQRQRADAHCRRRRLPFGGDIRLVQPRTHAAAEQPRPHRHAQFGLQPLLPPRMPARPHRLPEQTLSRKSHCDCGRLG